MLKQMFTVIAIAAVATVAGYAQVNPAKVLYFKDWAVACDNGLGCEATVFFPETPAGESWLGLSLSRAAGREGFITISIHGFEAKTDRYKLVIDGRVAGTGDIAPGADTIEIKAADAMKLARAMVAGRRLRMLDGAGEEIGQVPLTGSAAALRYIDAAQGRVGSSSAIATRGRKAAAGKVVPLPVIVAKKIEPNSTLPDAVSLVELSEISSCAAERGERSEDTAYSLGNDAVGNPRALVLLFCGTGAYNPSYGVYIGTRTTAAKWDFVPADFDFQDSYTETGKIPLIGYADWDAISQTLSGRYKGRGIGDCGSAEQYVWDGARFRLTRANRMDECRGSMDWLTVWRADVQFRD
jgi:hypothetical protein